MTRDIALAFNRQDGEGIFIIPEPAIPKFGALFKSLRDGTKKMSKSDPSDMSRINLSDSAEVIADKIKRAKTDTGVMPSDTSEFDTRPEVENLVGIYAVLNNMTHEAVLKQFAGQHVSPFKNALADLVVAKITPIGAEIARLTGDKGELTRILGQGRDKAAAVANKTLSRVKNAMGFVEIP